MRKSRSLHFAPNYICLFLLALFIPVVYSQCGSLITYRQHADLLETAPQCLRTGCAAGQNISTISSPCPSTSPCYTYWNMFVEQFDQSHSWCKSCGKDLACRISGWPVMNATAVCDTTPNQLLFGGEGCCIQDDEPSQLAAWTGSLCNGSEWRQPFDICGGMACLDWLEWIMPWNWTVRNDLAPPSQQKCTPPSHYLAINLAEQFFWLFFTLSVGAIRLWISRHEEKHNRVVVRYWALRVWKKFKQRSDGQIETVESDGEHLRPTLTEKLRWGFPVVMGVIIAGAQLGFNFFAASLIKRQPGFHDVPLGLLALLFCCRPRLSFFACLLALVSKKRLVRIFKFKPDGDGLWAAKLVLTSVAVTSAVTEAIMQLLSAYFLGRTAQIGQERGFYYIHHLRPKLHGKDARLMYLGALFWVILCIPLLIVWFLLALFMSQIYHAVTTWRRSIFNFLNARVDSIPGSKSSPKFRQLAKKMADTINPDDGTQPTPKYDEKRPIGLRGGDGQVMPVDEDQPMHYYYDPGHDQPIPVPYGGSGASDIFNDDSQPMPVYANTPRRSPYSQLSQSDLDDQVMPVPRAASGSHRSSSAGYGMGSAGMQQRRSPSGNQYNALAQHDEEDDDQVMAVPSSSRPRQRRPEMTHISGGLRNDSRHSLLPPEQQGPPQSSGSGSGSGSSRRRRHEYKEGVTWGWPEWERPIIFAGAFFGMLAYVSQWMFWDGFVKASGDRFCPPKVWDVGGVWAAGSFLYVGIPFLGY